MGTLTDYVCLPAKCMKTSKDFYIQCYKAYDNTWVYTRAQVNRPDSGRRGGDSESVLLIPIRTGPQYACPYCGSPYQSTCWNCGKEMCFDGDRHEGRELLCLHCGELGVFRPNNKRNRSAGVSGNGQ